MAAARKLEQQPAIRIGPQPGPQAAMLSSPADIVIFGGAAGGGKSFGILLEPLRHFNNPLFSCVTFRRTTGQIRNPGGLWDQSYALYKQLGAHPREAYLTWEFPRGMGIKFAHLEHEKNVYDWQGTEIALLQFDELTHFTEHMFFYMLSRVRSTSGVPGYVRATCNPDADSWVRKFIDWWIGKDGYPVLERCSLLRWFIRRDDEIIWGDSREELLEKHGAHQVPMSATFIPSKLDDNPLLVAKDPTYRAKLMALSRVDRERLLGGNWNIRASAGNFFRTEWFPVVPERPSGWVDVIRFWDRAATRVNESNKDPDWTRGALLYKYKDGSFCVGDMKSIRGTPGEVETLICNVASHDGRGVRIMSQQDPGSAGVSEANHFVRMLAGYVVKTVTMPKDKITRAKPVSAQAEAHNIKVVRAPWNDDFFRELENFPDGAHDDQVDVLSGAFNELTGVGPSLLDVL